VQSRWNDRDLAACLERFAPRWGERLALRVYTSRLIGSDPHLVLHGGGNTSLKGTHTTLLGDRIDAIWVKGSGSDLDAISPPGFPGLDLAHLRRLRALEALSDEHMVNELRTHLFDAAAPSPSVETLLHAFLPHSFIDHTHADAALILTHQPPDLARELIQEAFPGWGVVPYVMPGFQLAKLAAETYERQPKMAGLVLMNHGLFTFAEEARESYERMIEAVDRAETVAAKRARPRTRISVPAPSPTGVAETAVLVRGALAKSGESVAQSRLILDHRGSEELLQILAGEDLEDLAASGPLTPDHVLRTKPKPMLLRPGEDPGPAVERYRAAYDAYFQDQAARASTPLRKLDAAPRVVLVPGMGLFAWGRSKRDAVMTADLALHTLVAKDRANAIARYVALPEDDLFDVEYWSLEQAKLGTKQEPLLAGQVAFVTGGAGAIGFSVAKKLVEAGASVVVSDLGPGRVQSAAAELDPQGRGRAVGIAADVTDPGSIAQAFREACLAFGGVDLVVPCSGIALVSKLEDMDPRAFRNVVDVNLTGTLLVLREAARIFRRQELGGNVVLISTKNVFAPGAEFGAYSASKAGAHQLARVAALEWASMGVRVNMVSVDAVFGDEAHPSGLWQTVGPERAKAHGIDPEALPDFYRRRNLLKVRVTGEEVGAAVVFFASSQTPTTGATLTVDGGLPDATPR
jgi:rhamnulose-1-phosphate aldolase/alcohol dehydrogenase